MLAARNRDLSRLRDAAVPKPRRAARPSRWEAAETHAILAGVELTTAAEACGHALSYTGGPLDTTWQEERWSKGSVKVAALSTAHPDFDGVPITKNGRMSSILTRHRSDILAGTFPRSQQIIAGGPAPAVMVERDDAGELFVADGQGRVLSALWNGVEYSDAYVFNRPGTRTLPSEAD